MKKEVKQEVKKNDETSWDVLKPMVISHLNDFRQKNKNPILNNLRKDKPSKSKEGSHNEIELQIKVVIFSYFSLYYLCIDNYFKIYNLKIIFLSNLF